jgi:DNA-binding GntR family transcriptional regulator
MKDVPAAIQKATPLADQVYRALKEAIVQGRLRPGDRLVESEVASTLGVSRTPVREAFRRLQQEGFLTMEPRGARVTKLTKRDILEIYACRRVLEGLAASLAARNRTEEDLRAMAEALDRAERAIASGLLDEAVRWNIAFHDHLIRAGGNLHLMRLMDSLRTYAIQYRTVALHLRPRPLSVVEEHRRIYEAIVQGDALWAEDLMKMHIANDMRTVEEGLPEEEGRGDLP